MKRLPKWTLGLVLVVMPLLTFIPCLLVQSVEDAKVEWSEEMELLILNGCVVALCVALAFDVLLDLFSLFGEAIWLPERLMILIASVVPSLLWSLSVRHGLPRNWILAATNFQRVFIAFPLLQLVGSSAQDKENNNSNNKDVHRWYRLRLNGSRWALWFVWSAAIVLTSFWESVSADNRSVLVVVSCIFFGLAAIVLMYEFIGSIYRFLLEDSEIVPLIYCIFSAIYFFTWIAHAFSSVASAAVSSDPFEHHNSLVFNAVCIGLVVIATTIVPGRVALKDAVESKQLLDTKHCFIRYVGHQLRTPINIAVLALGLLELRCKELVAALLPTDLVELISSIRDAHTGIAGILDDLLTYDKLVSKVMETELHLEKCSVITFIRESLRLGVIQATAEGIAFHFPETNDPDVIALRSKRITIDKAKLGMVFANLASNAVKFTPKNGTIRIQLSKIDGSRSSSGSHLASKTSKDAQSTSYTSISWLRFSITDSGVGISQEGLKNLFKETVRFNARDLEGSGLGLFISKGIVELHGGRIYARSSGKGHGATFVVEIPLDVGESQKRSFHSLARSFNIPTYSNHRYSSNSIPSMQPVPESPRNQGFSFDTSGKVVPLNDLAEGSPDNDRLFLPPRQRPDFVPEVKSLSSDDVEDDLEKNLAAAAANVQQQEQQHRRSTELLSPPISNEGAATLHLVNVNSRRVSASCQAGQELQGKRVLLVDDCVPSMKIVCRLFTRMGATCTMAENGKDAVDLVKKSLGQLVEVKASDKVQDLIFDASGTVMAISSKSSLVSQKDAAVMTFDMVVMDNLMPVMNGPEACALMRRCGYTNPIFGLTGHGLPADVKDFMDNGANHIFLKPLKANEFVEELANRSLL